MIKELSKSSSGISGLDAVLKGGYPNGRTTLINGGSGAGKTLLGLQFVLEGMRNNEPGIFISFEERSDSIRKNALSLGWELEKYEKQGKLALVDARPDPSGNFAGDFDFSGLYAILNGLTKKLGATRVVIDAIDLLLYLLRDPVEERNRVYQLHDWILDRNLTVLLTAKTSSLVPDYPFIEFLVDCVIELLPLTEDRQRFLRIVKYRGSDFNASFHPYTINREGVWLYPMNGMEIHHHLIEKHVSTGLDGLDRLLSGGYRQGTCILFAGSSGTGKTTFATKFAISACSRGERVLYVNFEESANNMVSLMKSSGTDLNPFLEKGNLKILAQMPEAAGPQDHLYLDIMEIEKHKAQYLILDAVTACKSMGSEKAAHAYLIRIIHYCRTKGITLLLIHQSRNNRKIDQLFGIGFSSLIDTIIYLNYVQISGELNRTVMVLKARGSEHSNQYMEFLISSEGIEFMEIYSGKGGMLTGTARLEQESAEKLEKRQREELVRDKQKEIKRLQTLLDSEITVTKSKIEKAQSELATLESESRISEESEKLRIKWRKRTTKNHNKKKND